MKRKVFVDTSAWLALVNKSDAAHQKARKVRTKEMKRKDAGRVVARFLADMENDYYTYLPLEASYYRLARDWDR